MLMIYRYYEKLVYEHFRKHRQMLFLMGPRQVGKTTICLRMKEYYPNYFYFSWDNQTHQELILQGPNEIAQKVGITDSLVEEMPFVVFDEIHKYSDWKNFLKGLYDTFPHQMRILVTGSARLDIFNKGGDSLMGRYLYYRFHPLSVGELLCLEEIIPNEIRKKPKKLSNKKINQLIKFGGYPDPYIKSDVRFYNQWKLLRKQQLFKEDLRDLSKVQELEQLQLLAKFLTQQIGQLVSYTTLAKHIRVSDKTIRSWLEILKSIYYCFEVKPWSKNVARSLLKEPKYYLWDWSLCNDPGAKAENFIACHLLKAIHYWQDSGFGEFGLFFLRDKNKREVDFLVVKEDEPWFLVEVKATDSKSISSSLKYFAEHLQLPHAFQVVLDMPYVDKSCFLVKKPCIVPASTFLSQLI